MKFPSIPLRLSIQSALALLLSFFSNGYAQVIEPYIAEASAPGAAIVQTFFVPFPETNFQTSIQAIYTSNTVGNSMRTIISIVIPKAGTIITYDHWEDGYEADPSTPSQSSTLVWGDGIAGNGIAPGYPTDIFPAGAVVTQSNLVSLPRNAATIAFDGRDRISSSRAIAITRAGWAVSPGTVIASASEVYDTRKWGTSFKIPVGTNTASSLQLFEYSSLHIMASEDGTVVNVDKDNNGSTDQTATLNTGETMFVNGSVLAGASVTSNHPIQIHQLTGDIGSTVESRTFAIRPTAQWGDDYLAPGGTTVGTSVHNVYLYNPGTSAISVNYSTTSSSGTLSVPANGNASFAMPLNTGARFLSSAGSPFYAVGTNDSGGAATANSTWDWGYALLPATSLTTEIVVGFGPGSDDIDSTAGPDQNGSPVWVTPTASTNIYVNYAGNYSVGALTATDGRKYDVAYSVALYGQKLIYDPNDKDMTRARIFTTDGTPFAAAWGEDSAVAGTGAPYLDMGTSIIPFPLPIFKKNATLVNDVNNDGLIGIGDTVQYSLNLLNDGVTDLPDTVVTDTVPAGSSYVLGSTQLNGSPYPDDLTGTPFPVDDSGLQIGTVPLGNTILVTFRVFVTPGATSVCNTANVSSPSLDNIVLSTICFPVQPGPSITGTVFNDSNGLGDNTVNGTGTNTGSNLYINLVNGSGTIVASTLVAANGTYTFTNVGLNTDYTLVLSTSNTSTTSLPPSGWLNSGEHLGAGAGSDNSINGILAVTTGTTNVTNANFGIQEAATLTGHLYIDTNGNGAQDSGEPNLPNVNVLITDANGTPQTVTTNSSGNWTASVPPGSTLANVDETDPDFPAGATQTQGTDPTTTTAVAGVSTDGGTDGFYLPATLTGHLYTDTNGNGTQDSGEPNLANVNVVITKSDSSTVTVSTNSSGNWTASVPPGSTTANVDETDPDFPSGATQTQGTDPTTTTAVAGVSTDGGTDGFYIPATLTGHLYTDTNGNGTQDSGEPNLANVNVVITKSDSSTVTVSTNSSGNWTASVPPGSTTANVDETDPDFPAGATQTQGTDPTTTTAAAGVSTDGGTDGFYIPATLTGHLYTDTNGNGTQDSGEPNLANVNVVITKSDSSTVTVSTNSSGNWTASVPPGSTTANVDETDPDFPSGATQTQGTDPTTTTAVAGVSTDGGTDGFYLPATLTGHLYTDTNGNGTQDSGEPNLANVNVVITKSDSSTVNVSTNSSGNWTASVPPGSTTANVDETDPDFPSGATQTQGTDPTTTTAVAGVSTDGGTDGFYLPATLTGHLYIDTNGNGTQDSGEPNLANVNVVITDANGTPQTVSTNSSGNWTASVPPGSTVANVDETDPDFTSILTPGYTQTQGTDPTTTTAVAGVSTDGGIDGFKPAATYTIAGQVRFDSDKNGDFQDPDQPLPGFTVKLYNDTNGDGIFQSGTDVLLTTQTSGPDGGYTFTGYPNGHYIIIQTPPNGSTLIKTNDKDLNNDRTIPLVLAGSSSTDNDFLEAADPQGWFYDTETGTIIPGGQITVPTVPPGGSINLVLDGSTGEYAWLTNGVGGIYTMSVTAPPGYTLDPSRPANSSALDPTSLSNPYNVGSDINGTGDALLDFTAAGNTWYLSFDLAAGDPAVLRNNIPLLRLKPVSFTGWQARNSLSGSNGPTENPDGDRYTNLQEFAFCYNPSSGVQTSCPLEIIVQSNGTIDATVRRITGAIGLTYDLEYIANLSNSTANGGGWTSITTISPTVVTSPDGTELATYANLAQIPTLASGQGFVRIKLSDSVTSTTARTDASGWATRTLSIGCQSSGNPFLPCPIFSGKIDASATGTLDLTTAAGSQSISAQFAPGSSYYVEVSAGDNLGHRWEINEASSTAASIVLDTASSLNTQSSAPTNLTGDTISIRRHLTINDSFPVAKFHATNGSSTADRILIPAPGTAVFTTHWLFSNSGNPRWVDQANVTFADTGTSLIDNGQGTFIHPKSSPVTLIFSGQIRANDFVQNLPIGSTLVTPAWPLDQSPSSRSMSLANGFTGNRNPKLADKIQVWAGDETPGSNAYASHYLLNYTTFQHWTTQANATLTNENALPLFKQLRANFIRSLAGKSNWVTPLPWTP